MHTYTHTRAGCCVPSERRQCGDGMLICRSDNTSCGDAAFGGQGEWNNDRGELVLNLKQPLKQGVGAVIGARASLS